MEEVIVPNLASQLFQNLQGSEGGAELGQLTEDLIC